MRDETTKKIIFKGLREGGRRKKDHFFPQFKTLNSKLIQINFGSKFFATQHTSIPAPG
jgi:hypothetical protein